jgi:hypothetical protein
MKSDTSKEIAEMQNRLWMSRTPQERAEFQAAMFMAGREVVLASMPTDLSGREFKQELYYRTYGEPLPEDFFEQFPE